jgi:hypothetical protein
MSSCLLCAVSTGSRMMAYPVMFASWSLDELVAETRQAYTWDSEDQGSPRRRIFSSVHAATLDMHSISQ